MHEDSRCRGSAAGSRQGAVSFVAQGFNGATKLHSQTAASCVEGAKEVEGLLGPDLPPISRSTRCQFSGPPRRAARGVFPAGPAMPEVPGSFFDLSFLLLVTLQHLDTTSLCINNIQGLSMRDLLERAAAQRRVVASCAPA